MSKQNNKKDLKRRYGQLTDSISPYLDHLDLRPFPELDDEGFAFIISSLKGVKMLDLNETAVSNKSIAVLTRLEYVKELRLKDCTGIDDRCIFHLNQLDALQFLHLNGTGVTIDGLLQLTRLGHLESLLFSSSDTENIGQKMQQLQLLLPDCKLIVNSKPWLFKELNFPGDEHS